MQTFLPIIVRVCQFQWSHPENIAKVIRENAPEKVRGVLTDEKIVALHAECSDHGQLSTKISDLVISENQKPT